jgi:hypothetical protein
MDFETLIGITVYAAPYVALLVATFWAAASCRTAGQHPWRRGVCTFLAFIDALLIVLLVVGIASLASAEDWYGWNDIVLRALLLLATPLSIAFIVLLHCYRSRFGPRAAPPNAPAQ